MVQLPTLVTRWSNSSPYGYCDTVYNLAGTTPNQLTHLQFVSFTFQHETTTYYIHVIYLRLFRISVVTVESEQLLLFVFHTDCSYTCHLECQHKVRLDCNQRDRETEKSPSPKSSRSSSSDVCCKVRKTKTSTQTFLEECSVQMMII